MEIKRQKYCLVGKEIKLQDWALRENMFLLVVLLLVCSGEVAIHSQVIYVDFLASVVTATK